jgi:hypothetical protein
MFLRLAEISGRLFRLNPCAQLLENDIVTETQRHRE